MLFTKFMGIGQYLGIETIKFRVSIVIMFQFNIK